MGYTGNRIIVRVVSVLVIAAIFAALRYFGIDL